MIAKLLNRFNAAGFLLRTMRNPVSGGNIYRCRVEFLHHHI